MFTQTNTALFALVLALSSVGAIADTCTTVWEYKIVRVDGGDKLKSIASTASSAAGVLEERLNGLGANGWEIASSHSLVEYEDKDPTEDSSRADHVVELNPPTVLLRKGTTTCK